MSNYILSKVHEKLKTKNRAFLGALIIMVALIYGLAIVRMKGLH